MPIAEKLVLPPGLRADNGDPGLGAGACPARTGQAVLACHQPGGREPARGAGRRPVGRRCLVLRRQPRNRPRAAGPGESARDHAPAGPLEGRGGAGSGSRVEAFAGTGPAAGRSWEQLVRRIRHQVRGKLLLRARGAAPAAGDRVVIVPQGCDQVHLCRLKAAERCGAGQRCIRDDYWNDLDAVCQELDGR